MFDTYVRKSETSQVTVHEHRAPTDDSIRLYHELCEKAKSDIHQRFATDANNAVQGVVSVIENPMTQGQELVFAFSVNGTRHIVSVDVPVVTIDPQSSIWNW
jgi:hypothetical protein